jgi:hypothetical protein
MWQIISQDNERETESLTPFQRLLADKDALIEYVEHCKGLKKKLEPQDVVHSNGVIGWVNRYITFNDTYEIKHKHRSSFQYFTTTKEEIIYIPLSPEEWMEMPEWERYWSIFLHDDIYHIDGINKVGHPPRDIDSKHLLIACARAVKGK